MISEIPKVLTGLTDLFYPRFCPACREPLQVHEEQLCLTCYQTLPQTDFLSNRENPMEKAFWGRLPIEKAAAFLYFTKEGKAQQLMHEVKYRGQWELGRYLGQLFGLQMVSTGFSDDVDMVIPVPLHPEKLKKRGYNQAAAFGEGVSEATRIPMRQDVLIRREASATQTRKGRYDRWENVSTIFSLDQPPAEEHAHVLLLDDVLTTGATLEASGHTLRSSSSVSISVATLSFAATLA